MELTMSQESQPPLPALAYETPGSSFSREDVGVLALKIAGIYCLLQTPPFFSYLFMYSFGPGRNTLGYVGIGLTGLGGYGGAGILLLSMARRWGPRLLSGSPQAYSDLPVKAQALQEVAFSVLGLFAMVQALPQLIAPLAELFMRGRFAYGDYGYRFGPAIVELLLGIALFLGGKGAARIWHKLRTGGIHHANTNDAPSASPPPLPPQ